MILPIALTCGDPNGIGIDLTFEASKRLNGSIPFFLIADASHLHSRSNKEPFQIIKNSLECFEIGNHVADLFFRERILPAGHIAVPGHDCLVHAFLSSSLE